MPSFRKNFSRGLVYYITHSHQISTAADYNPLFFAMTDGSCNAKVVCQEQNSRVQGVI